MSARWLAPIYEDIERLEWVSRTQKREMKRLAAMHRALLDEALGLYELQGRRGAQTAPGPPREERA